MNADLVCFWLVEPRVKVQVVLVLIDDGHDAEAYCSFPFKVATERIIGVLFESTVHGQTMFQCSFLRAPLLWIRTTRPSALTDIIHRTSFCSPRPIG